MNIQINKTSTYFHIQTENRTTFIDLTLIRRLIRWAAAYEVHNNKQIGGIVLRFAFVLTVQIGICSSGNLACLHCFCFLIVLVRDTTYGMTFCYAREVYRVGCQIFFVVIGSMCQFFATNDQNSVKINTKRHYSQIYTVKKWENWQKRLVQVHRKRFSFKLPNYVDMEKVSHRSIRSLAHKSVAVDENNNNGTYSQSNGVDSKYFLSSDTRLWVDTFCTSNKIVQCWLFPLEVSRLQAFFACDLDAVVTDAIIKGNELSNHISHAVITASVQKLLRRKFKYIECHLIGSRVNGTTVNDGAPLDVYLDFGNYLEINSTFLVRLAKKCFFLDSTSSAGKNLLNDKSNKKFSCYMTYLQSLMNASSQWSNVERVEQTQFGILSATHNTTKMNCRFVFGSGEFVGNNDMIESFLTEQTMCKWKWKYFPIFKVLTAFLLKK